MYTDYVYMLYILGDFTKLVKWQILKAEKDTFPNQQHKSDNYTGCYDVAFI